MKENDRTKGSVAVGEGHRRLKLGLWLTTAFLLAATLSIATAVSARAEEPTFEGQIVGGGPVPNGKYPFMASLQTDLSSNPGGHFCGGTLIDRDSVLTAAHCVEFIGSGPNKLFPVSELRVVVGTTALKSNQGQERGVRSIKIHPRYNSFTYDAAVIQLDRPVTGIKPIKVATARQNSLERPGRQAQVTGWGNTIKQEVAETFLGTGEVSAPNRMREARVPLVSDSRANRIYKNDYRPRLMVAAGKLGVDSCQGDSGGPLFASTGKRYTQIGITSFGLGCGALLFPGVYAEVNSPPIKSFIVRAAR